ncbi:alanine dehydrogenase [Paenibacillus hamazuiensis]|uniref:alanine dehydrogenase n=1 Tax=Paenibacillus hamazuiensis TaxID=2936508 RepID=UPI00200DFD4B|nr:alanine dehydrogenase [Paenibacillus hamazuiensis]
MKIGVPKEIKNQENRIAMTPAGAAALVKAGHEVFIEKDAGAGSGFANEDYTAAGAAVADHASDVWRMADMVMKVKEPLPSEFGYFREDLVLFAYLHLAADPGLTRALVETKVAAIAYETVSANGSLPLLKPMSEVAGRMSVQIGAQLLEKPHGGKGILLGGVPGVKRGKVTVIGGGVVGTNAAKIAAGLGADVTVIDSDLERLRQLADIFGSGVQTLASSPMHIADALEESDLVVGAVLIPGAKAPKLVTDDMVRAMKPGAVIVDVAVDHGGIFETVDRVTTHAEPTYEKHGVIHYAVANMPGAVPRTSTFALTNATLPYALQIAGKGVKRAVQDNKPLRLGLNAAGGSVTHEAVAKDLGYEYTDAEMALEKQLIG